MKNYLKHDEWCIIEEGFHREYNEITESVCSLGNGRMGQRGNFEETFTGKTLQGNYVAGVYYPDKTRVGWWKNGYPEYFAKVLNAANWIGIKVEIDGEELDLNRCEVADFRRVLNMREGYLERSFIATLASGKQIKVYTKRFNSIVDDESGAISYSITPLNFDGKLTLTPFIDGDIKNKDANYDEKFWDEIHRETAFAEGYIELRTKKTGFHVVTGQKFEILQDGKSVDFQSFPIKAEKYVASQVSLDVISGQETTLIKYACNLSSENYAIEELLPVAKAYLAKVSAKGYAKMLAEQAEKWISKWHMNDIVIEGDVAAQQGIRFNIFQLNQTYSGEDARLNIGPKGFTGEKYGGSTYWDTEAYCIPFYMATADAQVARNLLVYRWKQLGRAIENAGKLGFKDGAALYPMVTMNGEECHNEWEITFEEIHRNGAIAYAIYDYINYTDDKAYLAEYGFEVLLGIARFWAQRVNWSIAKKQYVMLGVTGPNEYENNVNNNWYTSYIAVWCLKYAKEAAEYIKSTDSARFAELVGLLSLNEEAEFGKFQHIIDNMYLPEDKELGVYLQQDGFLDKELIQVKDLAASDRPINQKWSWDRILRSCFIKQADVLQGIYFFEDDFDIETIRRNYDFYEPMTVHESSLSPCVHSIIAAKLGDKPRSYEFYQRSARLDLDDYNNDTEDGLHITSMAGTWMSVIKGFGGMRVRNGQIFLNPFVPENWKSFAFKIRFRNNILNIITTSDNVTIENLEGGDITINVGAEAYEVKATSSVVVALGATELA
ncbi:MULTISPECIES: glycoside hydrolase family 65 protein [Flectobacillus]|uniref:glycoside hydrolase family 65 protein n=1 Tax=Flectobacillus TaxID=101 RepID=UPI000BA43FF3|nr:MULTISPECIES: glycoside hydrolase family 65 protein [Flectobacillus]MDI9871062.1 glycoside hydrolase family 65 protein [Flectobacillus roseus]PAC29298.1 family 65 glycosyl hydrolase [Flectobacillus sp. BAB-3569]